MSKDRFVPIELISIDDTGCHVRIKTHRGERTLLVGETYTFFSPKKSVAVPKFVAEHIEYLKSLNSPMRDVFGCIDNKLVQGWLHQEPNADVTLARAWLEGYTIEKEKLYTVEIPNPNSTLKEFQLLALAKNDHGEIQITSFVSGYDWKSDNRCQLTEDEIRKDFEWAWQVGFAEEVE